ncbi:hypothetical protein CRG98_043919 [Punica granatum]|uniref:Uncharacterized protein n=1 Tax=Punica granatum TaxID=22663 RepID=A0A2I0HVN3_PUNGR|nr:hypothetical protein CRG98_043919 [Punica granatum]
MEKIKDLHVSVAMPSIDQGEVAETDGTVGGGTQPAPPPACLNFAWHEGSKHGVVRCRALAANAWLLATIVAGAVLSG